MSGKKAMSGSSFFRGLWIVSSTFGMMPRKEIPVRHKVFVLPDAKKNLRRKFSKKHVVSEAGRAVDDAKDKFLSDETDGGNILVVAGKFGLDPFLPTVFVLFDRFSILVATKKDVSLIESKMGDHGLMGVVENASKMIGEIN